MSKHIKYNSIDNHYLTKEIEWAKKFYGELFETTRWSGTEKIDGANISCLFQPMEVPIWFSRNQEIKGDKFFNSKDVCLSIEEELWSIQRSVNQINSTVRFYGELFGPGIQKKVDYGVNKRIRFFNMMIDDQLLSDSEHDKFADEYNIKALFCNQLWILESFEAALEMNSRFDSEYSSKPDNLVEGIVIKPYDNVLIDINYSPFFLKKKNEEFLEKSQVKTRNKKKVAPEVHAWHETFLGFINEQRINSVFSKEGRIESPKDIGKYIPKIQLDASDAFFKEEKFPTDRFDKNEHRYIFNGGKKIAMLLKKELGQ